MSNKIVSINGSRYLVEGDEKYLIHTHKDYGEYVYVDNELDFNDKYSHYDGLFTGCIKDAVDTIKSEKGDVIEVCNMFGGSINVIRFLNREVGEKLRERSLEGFADTKFAWIVTCGSKMSTSAYAPVTNGYMKRIYDRDYNFAIFNSREEAVTFAEQMLGIAKSYVVKYCNLITDNMSREDRTKTKVAMLKAIHQDFDNKVSAIYNFADDMVTDDMRIKENYAFDKYDCKIEQYILP